MGAKPSALEALIDDIQKILCGSSLKDYFQPYPLHQIHGTIIGLEKALGFEKAYNANLLQQKGQRRLMDFFCLVDCLEAHLPFSVRIGGFEESYDEFLSLGQPPYRRSFGFNWRAGKAVLIGWPYQEPFSTFNFSEHSLLWTVREMLGNCCCIWHKYHLQQDNDIFLVLGDLNLPNSVDKTQLEQLQEEGCQLEMHIRSYLSNHPISLSLNIETLSVVQYEPGQESLANGISWKISDLQAGGISWEGLYGEGMV